MHTCFIHHQPAAFQRAAFEEHADNRGRIIPRCGGHLLGDFLPHESGNDIAWGLVGFGSLADDQGRTNIDLTQRQRFTLSEERSFCELVDGSFRQGQEAA